MIQIEALKIEVITKEKKFRFIEQFKPGVNIIRGRNSCGKSTCINAIYYALGIEQILGGRNEKVLKPALKKEIHYKKKTFPVLESSVSLQITNGEKIITLYRNIKGEYRDVRLVTVIFGPEIHHSDSNYKRKDMYLHDPGATRSDSGFHRFLENFMGWDLPFVSSFNGKDVKLYLETVFPSFCIEQIRGWYDFLSTIPKIYNIKNVSNRVVEFILDMDVMENEKKRQVLISEKRMLLHRWEDLTKSIYKLGNTIFTEVENLPQKPVILTQDKLDLIKLIDREKKIPINKKRQKLIKSLTKMESLQIPTVGDNIEKYKSELKEKQEKLNLLEIEVRKISSEYSIEYNNIKDLKHQLEIIEDDLIKNKEAEKLLRFGSDIGAYISKNICPTCNQGIKDTLLDQNISQVPMNIEDNISFLKTQKQIISLSIEANKDMANKKLFNLKYLRNDMDKIRKIVRTIKKDLLKDERLTSEVEIEKRINLRNNIDNIRKVEKEFENIKMELLKYSNDWKDYLEKKEKLPKDFFSDFDKEKLNKMEKIFRKNINAFEYSSKSLDDIEISYDKYIPMSEGLDLKFDISASDHIRSIWAYTITLYEVSKMTSGNHPGLIIFDEPGQQQMAQSSLKNFYKRIHSLGEQDQIIIATSLDENVFKEAVKGFTPNTISIMEKSIAPHE